MHKDYLGDSVYAEIENGMVKLTTENGCGASNEIFLEPEVIAALNRYVERIKSIYAKPQTNCCAECGELAQDCDCAERCPMCGDKFDEDTKVCPSCKEAVA